jgi:hypothetical protein
MQAHYGGKMQALLNSLVTRSQLQFFRDNKAGCAFAAVAARKPKKYGWVHIAPTLDPTSIDEAIERSINDSQITTLSLIFKSCQTLAHLQELVTLLQRCSHIFLGQELTYQGFRCLGFRVRVQEFESWVSGFGPFAFFPKTRQAPYTELIFRVKPRPPYKKVLKASPEGVIHLADMDMLGVSEVEFKKLWNASYEKTAAILGHKPDLRSAAKTTFILPVE